MDKKIKKSIEELKKVAKELYRDRDIDAFKYSEVKGWLDKLEGCLLEHDEIYDLKRAKPIEV